MAEPARPDFSSLDPCVHCGLCLTACPTYLATGDESDSPRGRIVLMRGLERGEIPATDPALREHLDRCLGCRGCEPACPSGVGYGRGLEEARALLRDANGLPFRTRGVLGMFRHAPLWRSAFGAARLLRGLGIARRLAGPSRLGMLMGMIEASTPLNHHPGREGREGRERLRAANNRRPSRPSRPSRPHEGMRVALFRGCIMDVLFRHVHDATRRTLEANGYTVVDATVQCCGAPHEHAGERRGAGALAALNLAAIPEDADAIAVNSAGCGAMLRDYGHLLGTEPARRFAERIRDVTELLARAGPAAGAPLPLQVAYDAPCHLQHAQRVHAQPLAVLAAIPGLTVHLLPGHDRCCGGAGAYSLLQPELSRQVLAEKIAALHNGVTLDLVATGNPGCIMQIGAGLRAAGLDLPVVHPVELLDRSYAAAGLY